MAVIIGNNNGNTLSGTNNDDEIQGLGGNDTLRGRNGDDDLYGGDGKDRLEGGDGDDLLDGGAGADRMIGGNGNDFYYVDNTGDVLVEAGGNAGGEDRVYSQITWTLADRFEHLYLQGTADLNGTGNTLNNYITGNSGNNVLSGLAGDDYLYGEGGNDRLVGGGGNDLLNGGSGVDHMTGGNGGDGYVVDNVGDVVNETGTGGSDEIYTSISYSIENNLNIEGIIIRNEVGGIEVIGNSLDNFLVDNEENDDGSTGASNVLRGRAGNDSFYFNENYASGDFAYGDEGNDTFYVEYASATMYGGTGDDTWDMWYGGGPIIEFADEGTDTVITMTDYTLGANLENLVIDPFDLDLDFFENTGTGNGLNNRIEVIAHYATIVGLGGDDVLISDRARTTDLWGGDGADQLYVDALAGVTTLHDFEHNIDTLVLHGDTALAIPDGDLAANRFHTGTAAQTAAHRIIYDTSTGNLYYDADGSGAGAQRVIAIFDGSSGNPDHTDFTVL